MKHIPHLVVGAPWHESEIPLSIVQWRHLNKVLKLGNGDVVTYTDGLGVIGQGRLGSQTVKRGDEERVPRPSELTLAVAPPSNKDRQRFLVEKLAEMGVARLIWLKTVHGKNRVAHPSKVFSWVVAAVEQSRGAWLMETSGDLMEIGELIGQVVACHPEGSSRVPAEAEVVVVGPEGGFADDELGDATPLWDLGPTVLRVETAAIVAAARIAAGS